MRFKYLYIIILILSLIGFANAATPVANFTSNITIGTAYPMVVQFIEDSSNTPTTWNWSFGDGRWFNTTTSGLKNPIYKYAVAGKYTVNLTVNNTDGSNTKSSSEYINLTSDTDTYIKSWLNMNGTNGSTIFSDNAGNAWSTLGTSYISTNQPKYGGASGRFDGTNAYISTPNSSAFSFGTGDFTIEFWMNTTEIDGANDHIIAKTNNPRNEGWGFDCTGGNDAGWDFYMGNDTNGQVYVGTSIPNKTWNHVVIERKSGTIYIYVNGTLTNSSAGFNANYDTSNSVFIARQSRQYYNGYIDELRISNGVARWTSNFATPYNEYRGALETIYPDVNPNSTFRYKTDPTGNAYLDNQTLRNRSIQIQNITNTSYIVGEAVFNPVYGYVKSVQLNLSYYPTGMTLISSSIDNVDGLIQFNVSKPTGFSPGTDRASILDYTIAYVNYTNTSGVVTSYFGYGYLINGSTSKIYSIHNFLGTPVTYGDWNFTANFTADNLTPATGTPVTFYATFNGSYPNRWYWDFGDGVTNDSTSSTEVHRYNTGGLKTVSLREYLWQNGSVANSIIKTNYINVIDTVPIADFTSVATGGPGVPVSVHFTDTSINYPTTWYWDYGDGNNTFANPTIQNPTHVYNVCGSFTVSLMSGNTQGYSPWMNKTNHVVVSCITPTPTSTPIPRDPNATSEKLATKMLDTQNILFIGVILIIIAGISVYIANTFARRSG